MRLQIVMLMFDGWSSRQRLLCFVDVAFRHSFLCEPTFRINRCCCCCCRRIEKKRRMRLLFFWLRDELLLFLLTSKSESLAKRNDEKNECAEHVEAAREQEAPLQRASLKKKLLSVEF